MNDAIDVNAHDRDRLLDLITEYAGKLRVLCGGYSRQARRGYVTLCFAAATLGFLVAAFIAAYFFDTGPPRHLHNALEFIVLGGASSAVVFGRIVYVAWLRPSMVRERFSITPLISAMEKLVSRAAFIEDHSLGSEDERLLLSLKIAEGEAALEYAALTLGKRTGSGAGLEGATRKYRSLANL